MVQEVNSEDLGYAGVIISDILHSLSGNLAWKFCFVASSGNYVAHILACSVYQAELDVLGSDFIPLFVAHFANADLAF